MGFKSRPLRVKRWVTALGVLVEQRGVSVIDNGYRKIYAYRVPTGGYHGLLRVGWLVPVRGRFRSVRERK